MSYNWKTTLDDGTQIIKTCAWSPPGCHPVGCGLKLFVKDGQLVKVEGDPDHPVTKGRLCVRCLSLKEYVNHPDRIIHPMKRDPKKRGQNAWEKITWDEAYELAAQKLKENRAQYGYEGACLFVGTGRAAAIQSPVAAFNILQTPNLCYAFSGYSCYGPRIAVTAFTVGAGVPEMDYAGGFKDRYDDPNFEVSKYVLVWGKDPLRSNADGMWGHCLIELMKRGTKLIVVDPRMNWLATRAEYALQLRPGTDAALALGLLNVIINEDRYDHDFVKKWTTGFEELVERVQEYPVAKVAEITGIPEDQIIGAARALAERPVSMTWGVALDENTNGVQAAQALLIISAITGNMDIPGGTLVGMIPGFTASEADSSIRTNVPEEAMARKIGSARYPAFNVTVNAAQPDAFLEALENDDPYPIRFAWLQSSNLLSPTCSVQPHRWQKALEKMDFTMVTDIFMTPTAMALADLFLPVAAFPEYNGVVMNHYGMHTHFVAAINKAVTVGECKSDTEIMFGFARVLSPDDFPLPVEQYVTEYWNKQAAVAGMKVDELREYGVKQTPAIYKKYEKGLLRQDGEPGFNTVSGKLEIKNSMFAYFGEDPLPYYQEPHYSPVSKPELKDAYPLILTTGARNFTSFHSEHRQIKTLRAIVPDPIVEVNPKTAIELGINDGDWVYIENMFGKAKLKAKLTPIVKPEVVNAAHGWWFPEEDGEAPNLFGVYKSNVNELMPHGDNSIMGFGAPIKNVICKMYKAN